MAIYEVEISRTAEKQLRWLASYSGGPVEAGLDLCDDATAQQAIDVLAHATPLDVIRARVLGPIDEAMLGDLVDRPRLGQELDQSSLALLELGLIAVQALEKSVATFEKTDVVTAQVVPGLERAQLR